DLGHRDLEVREHLEQVGLELLVAAVDLVHEEHGRGGERPLERAEQRAPQRELGPEELGLAGALAARLEEPDVHHLAGVVPLVDGVAHVQPFVALEANELAAEDPREHLRDLGLPHAGLALEEERARELQGQEGGRGEPAFGKIVLPAEGGLEVVDRCRRHALVGGRHLTSVTSATMARRSGSPRSAASMGSTPSQTTQGSRSSQARRRSAMAAAPSARATSGGGKGGGRRPGSPPGAGRGARPSAAGRASARLRARTGFMTAAPSTASSARRWAATAPPVSPAAASASPSAHWPTSWWGSSSTVRRASRTWAAWSPRRKCWRHKRADGTSESGSRSIARAI